MNKNRVGYMIVLICLAVLVFLYSNPFLLFLLIVLLVLLLCMVLFIQIDARALQVKLQAPSGVQEGKKLKLKVNVHAGHQLYVARSILIGLDIENIMLGYTERKYYFVYLSEKETEAEILLPVQCCGKMQIQCSEILLQDLLKLFYKKLKPFETVETMGYPRSVNVLVEMSRSMVGAQREDGRMQNRKGKDPSEMFDIREYVPGDDTRSIHWKLSSKTDQLIMREASEPFHYHVVLLPDFGRTSENGETSRQEINTAIAFGAAIGEQLLRLGSGFYMAIPVSDRLLLCEVRERRDFNQMMMQWLSSPIMQRTGHALQCFLTEQMQQQFTRLLILSAGMYPQNLNRLDGQIGCTVVSIREDVQTLATSVNENCEIIEIPLEKSEEMYRISC